MSGRSSVSLAMEGGLVLVLAPTMDRGRIGGWQGGVRYEDLGEVVVSDVSLLPIVAELKSKRRRANDLRGRRVRLELAE